MLDLIIAGVLAVAPQQAQPQPQDAETPTRLEDITVIGRPLNNMIQGFVREVAAPNRGRNLARWETPVCVGVANLDTEAAQYLVDRISTIAEDLGLTTGGPGCRANIFIVAADDADAMAASMIRQSPRSFRPGGSGMDRGRAQLAAFQRSDRPVRWWAVSMPTNANTGERAVRLPGECNNACSSPLDAAPIISVSPPSRLRTEIVDNLNRVIIVLDIDQVDQVSILQLADYIAMVSLAQIDPAADTRAYASILNVFDDPSITDSLTDWDIAYLQGLYGAERGRASLGANRDELVRSIRRSHEDLRDGGDS